MKKAFFLNIILLFIFLGCAVKFKKVTQDSDSAIKGRVVYQNRGLRNVKVYVYQKVGAGLYRPCLFASKTDNNGNFSINLPAGIYSLLVKNDQYFSYYGGNPVNISPGNIVDVVISCVKKYDVKIPFNEKQSGASGVVYYENTPLADSEVFFYLDMRTDLRGPAFFSTTTDKEGRFFAPLGKGTYFVICRKRLGLENFGSIQPGDFLGYYEDNPVVLSGNENKRIAIFVLKKDTNNTVVNARTAISGIVYDLDKKPVGAVYVCIYKEEDMVGKPEYISNKTKEDGMFRINLSSGGKFFLIAKENFGNIPKPGNFIGYLADSADIQLKL
ncbi:MAG: hypothetical protein ABII25_05135 [bacterium]